MATLRDLVYDNQIFARSNRDYRHHYTFDGSSGVMGNSGPTLDNAFYNARYQQAHYTAPKWMEYNIHWDKPNEEYNDFWPIICYTIDTDDTGEYGFATMGEVGENQWWGSGWYCGNNGGNFDLRGYGEYFDILDTDNYFNINTNNAYNYYDTVAGMITQGYDVIVKDNNTLGYWIGYGGVANIPSNLYGDPRATNSSLWNAFYNFNNPAFVEGSPREIYIETNIPVLIYDRDYYNANAGALQSAIHSYLTDGDLSRFANDIRDGNLVIANTYVQPTTQGVKTFSCYSDIYQGTWGYAGVEDETFVGYRYLQVFVKPSLTAAKPRVTLIKDPTPTELRARLKVYGDIEKVRYSTDGGNSWSESDSLPWEYLYYKRTDELGELKYDQNHGGNILLFASEALSDDGADYLAEDYAEKSQYYPSTNTSGTEETSTTMGVTTLNSFFQRMYIVDKADMATISSALYDTSAGGIWEDIKKGIEMFGENPIDCVAGLCYFPLDLTQVFSGAAPASSVFFGGYQLTGVSCYELMNYNGYVDIGTMEIKESFPHGSYRNYEPYTSLKIWLPFIGLKELHLNKYIGKTMAIRYYFDCFNGGCMAVIFSDGLVADVFDGMAGVQIPISLTDFASYAAAQIQNFTELGSSAVSAVAPLAGGASPSSLIGAAAGFGNYEKALFSAEQTTTSDFNSTKGASSAMINQYLPNYVYVIFEIIEEDETRLLSELMGKPSNASGNLGSFSGYLEVDEVELKTSAGMTETEKNNLISLLHSGIII